MKILLDEQLSGSKAFYQALGWDVLIVHDIGMVGADDLTLARYARENDLFLITRDIGMAEIASLLEVKNFLISEVWIARMVDAELRRMKP